MTCSRCGAEAAVKRESAFYCGKCAMARDWEEVIAVVQADRESHAKVSFEAAPPVEETPVPDPQPTPAAEPTAAAAATNGGNPAAAELPADPFG